MIMMMIFHTITYSCLIGNRNMEIKIKKINVLNLCTVAKRQRGLAGNQKVASLIPGSS